MILNNVYIVGKEGSPSQIEITGSRINSVKPFTKQLNDSPGKNIVNFAGAIAFPGLINSHDHLEYNLFPQLGNKIYNDYVEWGNDIHIQNKELIEKIQSIPYDLRFQWGLYKNLLCGVTTVAHHGKGKAVSGSDMPGLISDYNYLHSIKLEKYWKFKLNLSVSSNPFVIHLGEGKNPESVNEINKLLTWNLFAKKIIGVHGISLTTKQSAKLRALIWCPASNLFLYNRTAEIPELKKNTKILFGTDSTLSADWNIWDQLRLARNMNYLNDRELYNSITGTASEIWNLNSSGSVSVDDIADIVVSKMKDENEWESFYNTDPEDILLILKGGKIILIDKDIAETDCVINKDDYDTITINSRRKFVTKGVAELAHSIRQYIPGYIFQFTVI